MLVLQLHFMIQLQVSASNAKAVLKFHRLQEADAILMWKNVQICLLGFMGLWVIHLFYEPFVPAKVDMALGSELG